MKNRNLAMLCVLVLATDGAFGDGTASVSNLPSGTAIWRVALYATIVAVGVINGCEANRSGKPRVAIAPEVLVLARELAGIPATVGVSTNGSAP